MFDANAFMNAVFTEATDTKLTPCPAGEYQAQIEKIEPKSGTISKGERIGEPWASLNIAYTVSDQAVAAITGRDKCTVYQSVMLDLTPQGGLEQGPGKNINLGRVREACNLNNPGQSFSPNQLIGQMVRVSVRHVPSFRDPSMLVAEVNGVTRL